MRQQFQQSGFNTGGMRIGPGFITPVIKYIIIVNAAVYILQLAVPELTRLLGLVPLDFYKQFPNLLFQPFTYMWLHGGFGHILFNMFALWMFGVEIESQFGPKTFLRFYILSGIAGGLLPLIFQPDLPIPTVGASGAIYGVLAAYWVMFPNRYLYLYFLFPVKVKWAIPGFLVLGLLFGGSGISHLAHLGGAIFGFLYMKLDWRWLYFTKRMKEFSYRRKEQKLEKNRMKAAETMRRVDEILDKINEVGLDNLTKEERKFLEEASSNLSQKENNH